MIDNEKVMSLVAAVTLITIVALVSGCVRNCHNREAEKCAQALARNDPKLAVTVCSGAMYYHEKEVEKK